MQIQQSHLKFIVGCLFTLLSQGALASIECPDFDISKNEADFDGNTFLAYKTTRHGQYSIDWMSITGPKFIPGTTIHSIEKRLDQASPDLRCDYKLTMTENFQEKEYHLPVAAISIRGFDNITVDEADRLVQEFRKTGKATTKKDNAIWSVVSLANYSDDFGPITGTELASNSFMITEQTRKGPEGIQIRNKINLWHHNIDVFKTKHATLVLEGLVKF